MPLRACIRQPATHLPLGTPFAVSICIHPREDGMTASTITSQTPEPLRVIVAEDDPDARRIVAQIVRRLGHSCQVARDGREAWSMHQADRADLIICDWKMPNMDGLQLCRNVRDGDPSEWHTHFILVTGRNDRSHLVEGLHAGADEYITKPVDLAELEARLEAAWRVVAVHRALEASNGALRLDSAREYRAARTDPLTEVFNRLRLKEDLQQLEGRAVRYGHRYCAALCDVDAFKAYNDCFGHLSGDDALRLVARTIQDSLRSGDSLYRYGGEEFLAILPEQSLADAKAGMSRVRHEVETLSIQHAPVVLRPFLTISVGIAELGGGSVDDWLRRADTALYRAKSLGRNCVEAEETEPAPPSRSSVAARCPP
jgi:two-component system cell cycle response regulator